VLKLYAGVPHAQLLHFYMTVMQPILEYSAPFWHHSLSKCQIDQTEAIQKKKTQRHLYLHDALFKHSVSCWSHQPYNRLEENN